MKWWNCTMKTPFVRRRAHQVQLLQCIRRRWLEKAKSSLYAHMLIHWHLKSSVWTPCRYLSSFIHWSTRGRQLYILTHVPYNDQKLRFDTASIKMRMEISDIVLEVTFMAKICREVVSKSTYDPGTSGICNETSVSQFIKMLCLTIDREIEKVLYVFNIILNSVYP